MESTSFGAVNFGRAQLGDKRRTARLVSLVEQMCARPGGTLPQKFRSPADLQAFYRLMHCSQVTHASILEPHRQAMLDKIAQLNDPVLVLHDTTELDFTKHESLTELGQIGCGTRKGYLAHDSLTLLQLRDAARRADASDRQATEVVSETYVEVLSLWRHKKIRRDWTVREFYYALARLGGHQNRKHDHPPGWQVLWEGWKERGGTRRKKAGERKVARGVVPVRCGWHLYWGTLARV